MDFIRLVTWSGSKKVLKKKDIQAQKLFTGYHHFYNKDHQLSIAWSSSCFCWDHFSFLSVSHPYSNWWHIHFFFEFLLFFFISDSGASDVPLFYSLFFFIIIDLLSWTEFQHADDPCLGYFWKKFSIFQAHEGYNEILLMF